MGKKRVKGEFVDGKVDGWVNGRAVYRVGGWEHGKLRKHREPPARKHSLFEGPTEASRERGGG